MKKSITLVAGSQHTKNSLVKQLREYLSDVAKIKSYAIDEGIDNKIRDELVIISSLAAKDELIQLDKLDLNCEIIVANRTISYDHIDEIVLLPPGTDVLFVNDVKKSTYEGIKALEKLGIDYLNYIPYYPGVKEVRADIDIAITPGEADKVPSYIKRVYDIGPRIMDFTTITKILNKLGILDKRAGQFSRKFLKKIINIAKRLAQLNKTISELNQHLNHVIDGLNDGVLVYDNQGYISVFNENLKKIFNLRFSQAIGKNLKQVIYNKSLLKYLMDRSISEEKIFNIHDTKVLVNKFQLPNSDYVIATFKNVKETIEVNDRIKRELIKKGFYAKYTFDDIIGSSKKIKKLKDISKKLANTDLTILIEGESGTGKELLASAIHNASKRKNGPFLAVNFSALLNELVESELFGYEEGAFTGAKKGGKEGLFEQADGGTIFLDEIGDISPKVQAKLLRVLQEKEVMRIGGTNIKPIDVRIIAATNKDLSKLVDKKIFREDLYYRLKMGYIKVPPLRERKEDITQLIKYFIKTETREDIKIADEVIKKLKKYDWYGNVRELKNILSYMLAVRDNNYITLKDIPDRGFFKRRTTSFDINIELDEEQKFILKKIYELNKQGKVVGREKLAKTTKGTQYEMTKYQMRGRLDKLERMGLIIKKKGKHGTILSNKGEQILMDLMGNKGV
ncbi:sigma 54-interacting transcriptional regulator [Thermohalobacter berrensis]|uniref:Fis family transcriptional regulator n=1 Tax=Thermohalobacter berrensis TaxID=99594 RepID=A0A419T7Q6_9FIRM|nr:sigma 54-interacting transcriptional regulator [Thermohalobacter berrensis]RKD33511.1 Fis family transcriptional regulator [Thermohalobacter berrensis]